MIHIYFKQILDKPVNSRRVQHTETSEHTLTYCPLNSFTGSTNFPLKSMGHTISWSLVITPLDRHTR